ncbi:MAG TPA: hypothetical protein VM368_10050, partial [Flavisolibacter sp.]|nr:hypothetical protein [Flavisolibacter sp.]
VVYDVVMQEDNIYQLRLHNSQNSFDSEYIPEKIVIRKKGKIWISDMDNYDELINALTGEISTFSEKEHINREQD